jgi:hypothetical protein
MYDDLQSPYHCPLCLIRPSLCTVDAETKMQSVGCMTCNCKAPIFTQERLESKYVPLVKWDKWVSDYRKEHPNWHKEFICKGCLKNNTDCGYYNEDIIACPNAEYPKEE